MLFKDLLGIFESVTEEADGGYLALCPVHGDSRPSLRIWRGEDNKVRTTCRVGCTFKDIAKAVDLPQTAFFNATGVGATVSAERPTIVPTAFTAKLAMYMDSTVDALEEGSGQWPARAASYLMDRFGLSVDQAADLGVGVDPGNIVGLEYVDAEGTKRNCRSKGFQAYPRLTVPLNSFAGYAQGLQGRDLTGHCPGRWVSLTNPPGHHWGQYGVLRGQGGYSVTIVTEGPSDGLTAVAVGYDVVIIRGAGLASVPELVAELAENLRGTQVIAAGDTDTAGQAFNRKLAEGLKPFGIDVYALPIPKLGPKTDLTDWRESDPIAFPMHMHRAVKNAQPAQGAAVAAAEAVSEELRDRTGSEIVSSDQGAEAARIIAGLLERYGDTDAMNAHALVAWTDGRIRYAPGLGFYVWNGKVWERSTVKVRQEIHRLGAALMLAGKLREARAFAMTTQIDNMMTELKSVPSVYAPAADFDARPDLLNFSNGTVDLRTGTMRPHDKADMLTFCLEVVYKPEAGCPRWLSFLTEIMPGLPDMPDYLQRLTGYGITGHASEQCFAVLVGKGANGKSVLTDTLNSVFREISKTTPFATFEEKQSGGIPNDIAALRAARLVMASEGESGKPMSEAVLKRVTGKDMVTARFLRQEFFEFKPSFLLMLATNHKPKFRGQDDGLWRRVKLIPFRRWFAPDERDFDLDTKLMAEAEGIAAWAVRGAVAWYQRGLGDPAVVTNASREYRETSDALAGFFPGVIEKHEGGQVPGAEAYNAYREWCEAEGLQSKEVWSRKVFYDAMEERQVGRKKTNKGIALLDIRMAGAGVRPSGTGIFGGDDA